MASPHAGDGPHWTAALEHYHCDRLEDAYREALAHGIGDAGSLLRWYRVIEAETITRRRSEMHPVNEWLTLEYVPSEVRELRQPLIDRTLNACDEVSERLGWKHGESILLCILSELTESSWQMNPYGYVISKEAYEKICLPAYLVDEPEEYMQAVAHEYAHVISDALSDGHAPRWLEEAVSVLVERRFDADAYEDFISGEAPWHSPNDLEIALEVRIDDTEEQEDQIWLAYQQAGWIGRYLASLGDERRLGDLLRSLANEGFVRNLGLILRGQERVDGALLDLYGFDARQLFARTRDWMSDVSP